MLRRGTARRRGCHGGLKEGRFPKRPGCGRKSAFERLVLVLFRQDFRAERTRKRTRNENDSTIIQFLMCARVVLGGWKPPLLLWRMVNHRGLILPLANTTRPSTIVVFTRPVMICPDHGELLDLLKPAFAS